ncbi:MAG: trehalose-6-phosphate synthase, partial [Burkholderiales bacterium]|nr:trehalose-6-phosphate synthase [Burkholderiales bacterium]
MKTLRLQLRFLLPLLATLAAAAYLAVPLLDQVTLRWFGRDLNARGVLVANALSDSVAEALAAGRTPRLKALFERAAQDERLYAIGLCSPAGRMLQATDRYPAELDCAAAAALAAQPDPRLALAGGAVHVGVQEVYGTPPPAPA